MRLRDTLVAPLVGVALLAAPTQPAGPEERDGIVDRASVGASGAEGDGLSGAPDISAGGRYVAFQSRADLPASDSAPTPTSTPTPSGSAPTPASTRTPSGPGHWRVYVRDLQTGSTTLVSHPGKGEATAPSLSGNGRLVAYARSTGGRTEIVVADRDTDRDGRYDEPGQTAVRRVTGTTGDLRYQRTPRCYPPLGDVIARNWPCRPQLSADGSTLVFPARLSPDSPALTPYFSTDGAGILAEGAELLVERGGLLAGGAGLLAEEGPAPGEVIDFGRPTKAGKPARAQVAIRVEGTRPVEFRGVSVAGGAGAFRVGESTCEGVVRPGQACIVHLAFSPESSGCPPDGELHAYQARLVTRAGTPAGRTAFPVVAECRGGFGEGEAATSASGCPAPEFAGLHPRRVRSQDGRGWNEVVPAGSVELGDAALLALVVRPLEGIWARFVPPPDCSLRLVQPPESQQLEDQPEPCVEGRLLVGCTAYVLFRPEGVRPVVGTLRLGDGVGTLRLGDVFRFVGTGVRSAVVARRDPDGNGSFAGPGRPEARVVSVDGDGRRISGTQPSVSDHGRYVAFTSSTGPGRTGVYVHDTDRRGDGSYRPGRTELASYLPTTDERPRRARAAEAPSLSGDGSRVAFVASADDLPGQVYVRDLTERRTVLVSRAAGAPEPGGGPSWAPALSGDGTTVAFVSSAPDLVQPDQSSGGNQAYVRYLPDLEGGGVNELISVTSEGNPPREGDVSLPAIDAIGRRSAFQTSAPLVYGDRNGLHDAYVYELLAHATLRPASLDLGAHPVNATSDPGRVTFANDGPGPTVVNATKVNGAFHLRGKGCAGAVLHRGQSCRLLVVFAPTEQGRHTGTLSVDAFRERYTVSLVGTGFFAPELTLTPPLASPGDAITARGANFPARAEVTLTWKPGAGRVTVTTDARGRFTVSVPIYPNTLVGWRTLVASYPGGSVKSPLFLVVPSPGQPPGFHGRG